MEPMVLSIRQIMTDEEFFYFCQENPDHRFEREPDGRIIVMPTTGGKTGRLNSEINADVIFWNCKAKLGEVFDSSTAFRLPDGSTRSPGFMLIVGMLCRNESRSNFRHYAPIL